MVWKILFVLTFIFQVLVSLAGYSSDISSLNNLEWIIGLLVSFVGAFVIGIFYSLGWNKRIFSIKAIKIFLSFVILTMLVSLFTCCTEIYSNISLMFASDPLFSSNVILVSSIIGMLFIALIWNIFLLPFYIGVRKYCKKINILDAVIKPYWKLFAIYVIPALVAVLLYSISVYTNFVNYNGFDFIVILSSIYEILFIIGFAWNKNIFHKLFWQITFIPYIFLSFASPFLISSAFDNDFKIKEINFGNPITLVYDIILSIVFIYILYKYAFSKSEQNLTA